MFTQKTQTNYSLVAVCFISLLLTACSQPDTSATEDMTSSISWDAVQDSTARVHSISGFAGPEAVRYDNDLDVYFVSNFNGGPAGDANGFISRVLPTGEIDELEFMTGTANAPMHGPRGMYITGTNLYVADAEGVHGFDKVTGQHLFFIDFMEFEPGFLNDVARGADGNLYVTDTGASRLYRIDGDEITIVTELPYSPNGIMIDPATDELVLAPWGGVMDFQSWNTTDEALVEFGSATSGGNFDGIEFYEGRLLAASQVDSSLHAISEGSDQVIITMPGRPADIGLDTQRNQVAVPYVARNTVDIWQLPTE